MRGYAWFTSSAFHNGNTADSESKSSKSDSNYKLDVNSDSPK